MENEKTKELSDAEKSYYQAHHKSCSDAIGGNEKGFNEKIFYVSTGAILLSVTFLSDLFGPDEKINGIIWLIISWGGFVAAIIIHIISYLHCAEAYSRLCDSWKKLINGQGGNREKDRDKGEELINQFSGINKLSRTYNRYTAGFFFIGLMSLIIFTSINLINFNEMKDDNKPTEAVAGGIKTELGEQAPYVCPPAGRDIVEASVSAAPPTPVFQTSQQTSTDTSTSTTSEK